MPSVPTASHAKLDVLSKTVSALPASKTFHRGRALSLIWRRGARGVKWLCFTRRNALMLQPWQFLTLVMLLNPVVWSMLACAVARLSNQFFKHLGHSLSQRIWQAFRTGLV